MTTELTMDQNRRDTLVRLTQKLLASIQGRDWSKASLELSSAPDAAGLSRLVSLTDQYGSVEVEEADVSLHLPAIATRLAFQLADGGMFESCTITLVKKDSGDVSVDVKPRYRDREVRFSLG